MPNDKGTTNFGSDDSMASAVAKAKAARVPVGGAVPMPAMPRLDQPVANQQAVARGNQAQRILSQQEQQSLAEQGKLHQGVGAAYAANQPRVTSTTDSDGNEQPIDPRLTPRPAGAGLRPETVRDLEAVAAANSDDSELKKINEEIAEIDDIWITNEFGERVKSLLGNKKRRSLIEGRCSPMDFEDLLINGSINQKVPIIPVKLEPTFRSLQGDENLEILRMLGSIRGNDQFLLDTASIFRLTAGLHAINTRPLPNHLDKEGDFNEDMFRAKLKIVKKMALPVLSDLAVNYNWFTDRVQKLTVVDDIKGF